MKKEFKSGRGGPRKGAGRPPGRKRVDIGPAVLPETRLWLRRQKQQHGLSIGKAIDKLVTAEIERQRARD